MKLEHLSLTIAAALALGLAGCSKNESVTSGADDAKKAAASAAAATAKTADAAKAEAEKAAAAAKAEAANAAEAAKAEAARVADAAKAEAAKATEAARLEAAKTTDAARAEAAKVANAAQTQGLIDKARGLIAEGKYAEAAGVLQQLSGQALSADQTALVASLKEQIQKGLTAKATENAAGNVGGLLKR